MKYIKRCIVASLAVVMVASSALANSIVEYNENGDIIREYHIGRDSMSDSYVKEYDANGNVTEFNTYRPMRPTYTSANKSVDVSVKNMARARKFKTQYKCMSYLADIGTMLELAEYVTYIDYRQDDIIVVTVNERKKISCNNGLYSGF